MIRSILAIFCGNIFLFFFNLCIRLDDEFANGLIEGITSDARTPCTLETIQANYRKATGVAK
jgi:hypothetical protein